MAPVVYGFMQQFEICVSQEPKEGEEIRKIA